MGLLIDKYNLSNAHDFFITNNTRINSTFLDRWYKCGIGTKDHPFFEVRRQAKNSKKITSFILSYQSLKSTS